MRTLSLAATFLLAVPFLPAPSALAQDELDEFDEFEDEFQEEEEEREVEPPPPRRRQQQRRPAAENDEYDEFDERDPFEEEYEEEEDEGSEYGLEEFEGEGEGEEGEGEGEEEEPDAAAAEAERLRADRFRMHGTWLGPVGGLRVVDAGSAEPGSFRLALSTEFFSAGDFLVQGDRNRHIGAALSFDWTATRWLELWIAIASYANNNEFENPNLFIVLADTILGGKVFFDVGRVLTIGGDLELHVPSPIAEVGPTLRAMGIGIRANLTADLRKAESRIPLIARFGLQYAIDNSRRLIRSVERARYAALPDPAPIEDEVRHLVSPIERFGLRVNRSDFFNVGLGFEVPLHVTGELYLAPILDFTWGIPVNRQGYDCPFIEDRPTGEDGCLDRQGVAAHPMTLTLGMRVLPPAEGVALFLGIDVGLAGMRQRSFVRELMANPPYNVLLGFSYAFKIRPPPEPEIIEREVEEEVEIPAEVPPVGHVRGAVVTRGDRLPIPNAVVHYPPERDLTAQASGEDGRFVSHELPPSTEVTFTVTHPEFVDGTCAATIPADGGDVETICEMEQRLVVVEETEVQLYQQIHFAFDRAEILPESFGLMQQIADVLIQNPQLTQIEIQGHTDDVGTRRYNLDLSQRRANAVRDWLVNAGVDAGRLQARGYGLDRPIAQGRTEEARARNRRVQFVIQVRTDRGPGTGAGLTPPAPAPGPQPGTQPPPAPGPAPDAPPVPPPP